MEVADKYNIQSPKRFFRGETDHSCPAGNIGQLRKRFARHPWDFVDNQVMPIVPIQFKCVDCSCRLPRACYGK